jgi:hypothetical protein
VDDLTASPPPGPREPTDAVPDGEPAMTDPLATDAPATDPLATFRRWATTLFTLLVLLIVVGALLIWAGTERLPTSQILVALTGLVLAVVALLTLLVGLDRRRGWAIPAAIAICWILVAAAVIRVLADLQRGAITIPLEGIAAALVLTRLPAHRPAVAPRDRRVAIVLTLVFVASEAWPLVSGAGGVGRLFGAPAEALTLTTEIACGDLRDVTGDGVADRVFDTTVTWAWSQGEFLAGGDDGMFVHIVGNGESTEGALWEPVIISDDLDTQGPGIWRGMASPSAGLLQTWVPGSTMEVGIDVGARGLTDGSVSATLATNSNPPPEHGSVQVWAEYAHLDRWRSSSEPASCTW